MRTNSHTSIFIEHVKRISELEVEGAVEAIGGSYRLYEKMLWQALRLLPSNIKQMDEYICKGDLKALGVKVHGIKGSLRQAGYMRLAKAAETLETEAKAGNELYCRQKYGAFKNELLCFYGQINDAFQSTEDNKDDVSEKEPLCDISIYVDTLTQVKAAIEAFDSLLAAELLSAITSKRFGGRADDLIKSTMEALECYRPEAASRCIADLFKECIAHDD